MEYRHPILQIAVDALPHPRAADDVGQWPPPVLRAWEQARAALFAAEAVRKLIPPTPRRVANRLLDAARRALDDGDAAAIETLYGSLEALPDDQASLVATLAATAATRVVTRNPRNLWRLARGAVVRAVRILEADALAFVRALDAELVRLEAYGLVRRHAKDAFPAVRDIAYRGGDEHGQLEVLVLMLDGGRIGAFARVGRLRWFEGNRDDVLANVPDVHFQTAVDAVLRQKT